MEMMYTESQCQHTWKDIFKEDIPFEIRQPTGIVNLYKTVLEGCRLLCLLYTYMHLCINIFSSMCMDICVALCVNGVTIALLCSGCRLV